MSIFGIQAFIQSGSYKELKLHEEKGRILKDMIRDEQARLNRKRMVWRSVGVVGEVQKANTYEYSQDKLNEFLYSLGLLPDVACIDSSKLTRSQIEILKEFRMPGKRHVVLLRINSEGSIYLMLLMSAYITKLCL